MRLTIKGQLSLFNFNKEEKKIARERLRKTMIAFIAEKIAKEESLSTLREIGQPIQPNNTSQFELCFHVISEKNWTEFIEEMNEFEDLLRRAGDLDERPRKLLSKLKKMIAKM